MTISFRAAVLVGFAIITSPKCALADDGGHGRLTLTAAIDQGLRNSPRIVPAADAVTTAKIQRSVAASRFTPRISPIMSRSALPAGGSQQNLGLAVSQLLPTGAELQASADAAHYNVGSSNARDAGYAIGVSQPLLRGFGAIDRAEISVASRALDAASRDADAARQQLVVDIAQAYFAVVRQQRLVAECGRARERADQLEDMARARAQVGLSTQLDVFRSELFKSQAQAAVLSASDQLAVAGEELNILIGRRADTPVEVDEDLTSTLKGIGVAQRTETARVTTADQSEIQAALAGRADVVDAHARIDDARQRAAAARWNLLPDINLQIAFTHRSGFDAIDSGTDPQNGWRIGFTTTYPVNRGADAAAATMARLAVQAAERAAAESEDRAALEIARSARAVQRADDAIQLQTHARELAERQRELATIRYERGLADNLEVVEAENNAFQAQSALISAEIDRAVSVLLYQRAMGALDPDRLLQ